MVDPRNHIKDVPDETVEMVYLFPEDDANITVILPDNYSNWIDRVFREMDMEFLYKNWRD